jgi:hypothetical protein
MLRAALLSFLIIAECSRELELQFPEEGGLDYQESTPTGPEDSTDVDAVSWMDPPDCGGSHESHFCTHPLNYPDELVGALVGKNTHVVNKLIPKEPSIELR